MKDQTGTGQGPLCHNQSTVPTAAHIFVAPCHHGKSLLQSKRGVFTLTCSITLIAASYAVLSLAPSHHLLYAPLQLPPRIRSYFDSILGDGQRDVKEVLERACMPETRTVIITTLNAAWAKQGTMIDVFLESFWHGERTRPLLQHLVIVCVDAVAYRRCMLIHPHCLAVSTPGINFSGEQLFLSADYINLMWRRIQFLQSILRLNYSFVFTDTDVLWLRDPFPQLEADPDADLQIACDEYNGKPRDLHNRPNAGFTYVRANGRTVKLYDYWFAERKRGGRMADQEVFNAIKFEPSFGSIGLNIRFLDTQYFGGFCSLRKTDMAKALTVHANCCKGLEAKVVDLRDMLAGWKAWQAQNHTASTGKPINSGDGGARFHSPRACPLSWHRH